MKLPIRTWVRNLTSCPASQAYHMDEGLRKKGFSRTKIGTSVSIETQLLIEVNFLKLFQSKPTQELVTNQKNKKNRKVFILPTLHHRKI